ncbi:uncharacterized protein LOC121760500 [Salvia splendens]|uniref:uncharacterized protein LOC121760500 n=1 Tax=Salvia splendens TaxID=180675 RepID=UPI001C2521E3|nr:uncharacterized protein LOC121760500 [Salvia splendens]
MMDFPEMVEDYRLMDLGFDGPPFTWVKNELFERLDRVFVNEQWSNVFDSTRVMSLPRVASDHGPVHMRCNTHKPTREGRPFRFQNMWLRHKWNNEVFGNLHANLRESEKEVAAAQEAFEADPSPLNRAKVNKNVAQYILLLKMEEDLWRQKVSHRGDRDQTLGVCIIPRLLAPSPPELVKPNLDILHQLPDTTNMEGLISTPTAEEVKRAAWDISTDSAPGPDGFTVAFYHHCWDIIGQDVVEAVVQFFNGAYLPRSVTATMIVLLPKKDNPTTWGDFQPISLCNVSNKIITKILSARLAPLLPTVIAPNQSGFV